jgi:hypothetical protein
VRRPKLEAFTGIIDAILAADMDGQAAHCDAST